MISKSYDGTLANGIAATGVEGLPEAIVPISAIRNHWYDYNPLQNAVKSNNYPSSLSLTIIQHRTVPTNCVATNAFMNANDGDETGGTATPAAGRAGLPRGLGSTSSRIDTGVFIMHEQDNSVRMRNASTWWRRTSARPASTARCG